MCLVLNKLPIDNGQHRIYHKVSNDTGMDKKLLGINKRIESKLEVQAYIQNLQYALNHGASIQFQINTL